MRLLKNFPKNKKEEVKEKIRGGSLTLSHLSMVARAVRSAPQPLSCHEKLEILEKVEHTTTQESEPRLASLGLAPFLNREWARPVSKLNETAIGSESGLRLAITLSANAVKALEKFMALTTHRNPRGSKERAIELALETALSSALKVMSGTPQEASDSAADTAVVQKTVALKTERSRAIPLRTKQEVWRRDRGRCTYRDPESGKVCGSQYALQFDHSLEFSRAGPHAAENLRLLCRNHNFYRHKIEPPKA